MARRRNDTNLQDKYLKVLEYLEQNPNAPTTEACRAAGMDSTNFYRYKNRYAQTPPTVETVLRSDQVGDYLASDLTGESNNAKPEASVIVLIGSVSQVREILSGLI